LIFQIRELIGPAGILPAESYLRAVARSLGPWTWAWYAPSVLWWSKGPATLTTLCCVGIAAALL
jgi:hypothetical protein